MIDILVVYTIQAPTRPTNSQIKKYSTMYRKIKDPLNPVGPFDPLDPLELDQLDTLDPLDPLDPTPT